MMFEPSREIRQIEGSILVEQQSIPNRHGHGTISEGVK